MITTPSSSNRASLALLIIAALAIALGIYQWVELYQMRTSGTVPLCSFSASLDCASVWNSPLAHSVHAATAIPFAGWGLAWSLTLLVLALGVRRQVQQAEFADDWLLALRLTTGIGVLVALGLLIYSLSIKVFCPTCILFYLLVGAAAFFVFRGQAILDFNWPKAGLLSGGILLLALALMFYPGLKTPKEDLATAKLSNPATPNAADHTAAAQSPLGQFLSTLPMPVQQATSDALALYRQAAPQAAPADPKRILYGAANAPVRLVEWTDIRCGHCRALEEALNQIRSMTPGSAWSEEVRHFPLDGECNPSIQSARGGVSCLAAKVQICLIDTPDELKALQQHG